MFGITSMGAPNYFHQCKGIYDDLEEEPLQEEEAEQQEEIVEHEVFKLSKPTSTLSQELRSINHTTTNTTPSMNNTYNSGYNNTLNTTTNSNYRQQSSTITNKYISPLYQSAISKKANRTLVKEIPKSKVDSLLNSTIEMTSITNLKEQQSKHIRYNLDPREKYKYPVTSNQEFGWLTSTPSTTLNKDNERFEQTFNSMSHSNREMKYNQSGAREQRKFNFPCSHTDIVKYRNNMILNNHF